MQRSILILALRKQMQNPPDEKMTPLMKVESTSWKAKQNQNKHFWKAKQSRNHPRKHVV